MSSTRPYIAHGLTQQGRVQPTPLQAYEDDSGMCNTCPGELEPAEMLQREPASMPPDYPWRRLGRGAVVVCTALACLYFALPHVVTAVQVAAR